MRPDRENELDFADIGRKTGAPTHGTKIASVACNPKSFGLLHSLQRLLRERPTPERCVEAYYLQRTPADQVREPGVGSGAEAQRRNSGIFQLSFRVPIGAVTPGLRATAAPTPPSSSGAIGQFVPGVAAARSTWG